MHKQIHRMCKQEITRGTSCDRRLDSRTDNFRGNCRDLSFSRETSSTKNSVSLDSYVPPIRNFREGEQIEEDTAENNNFLKQPLITTSNKQRRFTYVSKEADGDQHFHVVDEDNFRIKFYAQRNILFLRNVANRFNTTRHSKMLSLETKAPLVAEDVWNNNHLLIPETPVGPISPGPDDGGIFGDMFEN